MLFVIKMTT